MAVDYDEGRRLLEAWTKTREQYQLDYADREYAFRNVDYQDVQWRQFDWLRWTDTHAEALLNPDPWRPISELPEEWKDGRKLDLWVRDYADGGFRVPDCKWGIPWPGAAPCWLELKPHPDALHDWEWQPIDFAPTHFRELKGPGQ